MTLTSTLTDNGCNAAELKTLLQLLSPFAPHICDEIWQQHGFEGICSVSAWPAYDESKCRDAEIDMAVQVNGKLRGKIEVPASASKEEVEQLALTEQNIVRHLEGLTVRKVVVIPGKLVNVVAN